MYKILTFILFLQVTYSLSLNAQHTAGEIEDLMHESMRLVDESAASDTHSGSNNISWLFEADSVNSIDPSISVQRWHQRFFQSDYGVRLTASANRHFGEGFANEVEDFDRYRISLGVEWDLYEQGWFKNQTKSKIYTNDIELLQLGKAEEELRRTYGTQYNVIIYLFNKEKIEYLRTYREVLQHGLEVYQKNYLKHLIPYHEVLELKKRIDKFDLIIKDYSTYNEAFESTYGLHWKLKTATQLRPMNISIDQLLSGEELLDRQIAIRDIENDNIYLRNKTKSDIRIGVYARTNFTNAQIGGPDGHYNTVGLRMSIPLRSVYSRPKQLTNLEVQENNQRHDIVYKEQKKELMVSYYEYEYSLQQYRKLYFDHLKIKEKIRQESVRATLDSIRSSVISRFAYFQEYMDIGYEKIGVRQMLYLGLLRIQQKLPEKNIALFCRSVQYKSDQKLNGKRIFLITTEDVKAYGIPFISGYLTNNEVDQIKALDLSDAQLSLLREKGIEVLEDLPQEALRIPIKKFTDRIALEAYIGQKADANSFILFDSFKDMIDLETFTLKNN